MTSTGSLGDDAACVLLRLQIWLLDRFHFLLLFGFGLESKHHKGMKQIFNTCYTNLQTEHLTN